MNLPQKQRHTGGDVDIETVRPFMRRGFPWHDPARENPPGLPADAWWEALRPNFEEALRGCDVSPRTAAALARKMRALYTDVREWRLYEDTLEVLSSLRRDGWSHAILSNHVPELPSLVAGLGLAPLVGTIVNSAETGFEKPHPKAFHAVLAALKNPSEVWMIGDNIEADVKGAEAVGLRAILARGENSGASRCAGSLREVRKFIEG